MSTSSSSKYIENVAIVGAGGSIGTYIVEELLKTGKHKITAITRSDSTSKIAAGVKSAYVNYEEPSTIVEALRGHDILIITMGVTAPRDTQTKLIDAAKEAGIKWIMPNEYGYAANSPDEQFGKDIVLGPGLAKTREYIKSIGLNFVGLNCGFWYQFSLAGTEWRYGFDFGKRTLTLFDDGNTKICTSTWPQCGRAIAKVLSYPISPKDERDTSLTLSQWKNDSIFIDSFFVSQRDMLASANKVMGLRDSDWTITHEDVRKRWERACKLMEQPDKQHEGFGLRLYSRVFFPDGASDFTSKLQNKLLDLPVEDFDKATLEAVELAKAGGYRY